MSPGDGLISLSKHEGLLKKWFEEKLAELKIIYRASDHEFTKKSYDDNCNDKGMTLTAV